MFGGEQHALVCCKFLSKWQLRSLKSKKKYERCSFLSFISSDHNTAALACSRHPEEASPTARNVGYCSHCTKCVCVICRSCCLLAKNLWSYNLVLDFFSLPFFPFPPFFFFFSFPSPLCPHILLLPSYSPLPPSPCLTQQSEQR